MPHNPSTQWQTCDGAGNSSPRPTAPTRRAVLGGLSAAALAAWAGRSALAQVSVSPHGDTDRDILVNLFLRGGADGLNIIVPHGDSDYYRARPTIAVAAPPRAKGSANTGAVDLDGFFGLAPALAPLHPLYADGLMAVVHAVGSQDQTRSHFEAMAAMERGLPDDTATGASGWLARLLSATPATVASPLRAVAWGSLLPDALRGATDVSVLSSLADFRLDLPDAKRQTLEARLAHLYRVGNDAVTQAGRETLAVLEVLRRIDPAHYRPENGATYPKSDLGDGLRQTACLIKARAGLEVAFLDRGGWDTHVGQGGATGWLALQLADVADSLAAFMKDLGNMHQSRVTVLVQTEFGRRVAENSGLGTDHGRASMMLVLGGGVHGGRVYGKWPGLSPAHLEGPGDLPVTTDYRTILAEIAVSRLRLPASALPALFPGWAGDTAPLGLARMS